MKLHELPQLVQRVQKRVGRGHGSGKGKTSGRGTKGQKARERIATSFEGGQLRLIKRLPFRRGVGNIIARQSLTVSLGQLSLLKRGSHVNVEALISAGIISVGEAQRRRIKIVGDGNLTIPLKVELPASRNATEKIKKAGGAVIIVK